MFEITNILSQAPFEEHMPIDYSRHDIVAATRCVQLMSPRTLIELTYMQCKYYCFEGC